MPESKRGGLTRAKAKRWFAAQFRGVRIERHAGNTFFVSHRPSLVHTRYGVFSFINTHHPSYDPATHRNGA